MEKKFFVSIEDMKKYRIYDGIGDMLFDLEKKCIEAKNQNRANDLFKLQEKILIELPFEKLVLLAVMISKLDKKEHKFFLNLSNLIRDKINKKWQAKIAEYKEKQ